MLLTYVQVALLTLLTYTLQSYFTLNLTAAEEDKLWWNVQLTGRMFHYNTKKQ
jgi:hypothetical protein